MSVVSTTPGPLSNTTSVLPTGETQLLAEILMELRITNILLSQGFNMDDSIAGIRNSFTIADLTSLS